MSGKRWQRQWDLFRKALKMPPESRDDLCRGRTSTCWNNEPFTAHVVHYNYSAKPGLIGSDGVFCRDNLMVG